MAKYPKSFFVMSGCCYLLRKADKKVVMLGIFAMLLSPMMIELTAPLLMNMKLMAYFGIITYLSWKLALMQMI